MNEQALELAKQAIDMAWNNGYSWQSLDLAAVQEMREIVKNGLGINCTFVDDDVRLVVALARRAIKAGLAEDADPATLKIMKDHLAAEDETQ